MSDINKKLQIFESKIISQKRYKRYLGELKQKMLFRYRSHMNTLRDARRTNSMFSTFEMTEFVIKTNMQLTSIFYINEEKKKRIVIEMLSNIFTNDRFYLEKE